MLDIIVNPFITILLFLYKMLGGNVVLAIVLLTVMVRLATLPLTQRQQHSAKAMQELQPELKRIQEKYKNDRERLAQAQWELYRQYGVNPMASCLPLLVQFPIIIALYRAIVITLAATPLQLLDLSERLWVPSLSTAVPMQNRFLWLNLTTPDPLYILPILVVVTTWLQQKLLTPPTSSSSGSDKQADQAAQISRQMMMIMPIMFGFFALSFASGLSIYFIASNLIGIVQYGLMGRLNVKQALGMESADKTATALASVDGGVSAAPQRPSGQPVIRKSTMRDGISDTRAARAKSKSKVKG